MDNRKVIRSAGIVGMFILISRVFGLIRDMTMAAFFGTSLAMSAFVVAFTIPNLFRALFGEGALSSAFVPVFTETREKRGECEVWQFAARMFSVLSVVLAVIVVAGILLATVLLYFFPDNERLTLILVLLRIMLPYMFFICLAAFFSAMLNSLHYFMLPAAVPVVLNLVVIATLFLVCPRFDAGSDQRIIAVAWGVVLAGVIQWLTQMPLLWRCGFRPRFSVDWRDAGVRRVWQLMGTAVIGIGVTRVNVLFDRFIAAFISLGSPAYLYFAERLIYFPLGIFATALGTVLLPALSGHAAHSRVDRIRETVNQSIRHMMFVMLPAAVGMMIFAKPIIRLVYERGDFTPLSTEMTMLALTCYAPGLIMFSMIKVLIPVFYAQQDMKTPVRVGLACTGLNIILSLILMWPLKHVGIALATVLAATVEVVLLIRLVHKRIGSPGWIQIIKAICRMLGAVAIMTVCAIASYHWLDQVAGAYELTALLRQVVTLLGSIVIAVLAYGIGAWVSRCPEIDEIWNAVRGNAERGTRNAEP
ncbi:murein biosynthesis integral membrane protein MurJ [Verrucomicrobiota bacterium]